MAEPLVKRMLQGVQLCKSLLVCAIVLLATDGGHLRYAYAAPGNSLCDSPAYMITVWPGNAVAEDGWDTCSPFATNASSSLSHEELGDARAAGVDAQCWLASAMPCKSLAYAMLTLKSDMNGTSSGETGQRTVVVRLHPGVYAADDLQSLAPVVPSSLSLVFISMNYTNGTALDVKERGALLNGSSASVTPMPVLKCTGRASNGSMFSLLRLKAGGRLALIGMAVQGCHTSFAVLVVQESALRLEGCYISHNFGQVLAVFNSQVDIVNSVFLNNTFSAIANTPATSLDIISFVGAPRWKGGMVFLYYNQSANSTAQQGLLPSNVTPRAVFDRSIFDGNGCFDTSLTADQQLIEGYLDGAAIGVLNEGQNVEVTVRGTIFRRNHVCGRGGGLFYEAAEYAAHNRLLVDNSTFEENFANEEGAGLSMKFTSTTSNNTVLVMDTAFYRNTAVSASGSDLLFDNVWVSPGVATPRNLGKQHITFRRCHWSGNVARAGSPSFRVRGHYARHQYAERIIVEDCVFDGASSPDNTYASSFLSVQANVEFYGVCSFTNNNVTAVMFETANMYVGGRIVFRRNHGEQGGGLRVRMVSQLYMEQGSQLEFYDNSARIAGGGIYWEGPPAATRRAWFRFNPDCLFVYATNRQEFPENWKFNATFVGNVGTNGGGAIYATSLSLCSWTSYNQEPFHRIDTALLWPFLHYSKNYANTGRPGETVLNDISTVAYNLHTNTDGTDQAFVQHLPPGEAYPLSVYALDELGQRVASTVFIRSNDKNVVLPVDAFFTRFDYNSTGAGDGGGTTAGEMDDDADDVLSKSRNTFQYVLRPNATTKDVSFSFTLRDNSVFQAAAKHTLSVNNTDCPLGFALQCDQRRCECSCTRSVKKYTGLLYCTGSQIFVLRPNYFLALASDGKKFEIVPCPNNFCACRPQRGSERAQEAAAMPISNRTVPNSIPEGPDHLEPLEICLVNVIAAQDNFYLCNAQRTGVLCGQCVANLSFHKHSYDCRDCNHAGTFAWRILVVVLGSLLVLLVLAKIKFYVPCKFFGFLVFAQFSQYNHITVADQDWVVRVGLYVEDLISMRWWFEQCLLKQESALTILSYGLIPAGIAIIASLIVLLLSLSFKVYQKLGFSPDHAIVCIINIWLVIYGGVMMHSFRLLHCVPVLGDLVLFLDGSVKCFDADHAPWGSLAIVSILFIGVVGPLGVQGLASGKLRPKSKVAHLLNSELKQDRTWWWLCEFGFRLVMAGCIASWTRSSSMMLLLIPIVSFMTAVALIQPYQRLIDNAFTAVFLMDLAIVETLRGPKTRSLLFDTNGYRALQAMGCLPYIGVALVILHFLYEKRKKLSEEKTWRMRVPNDEDFTFEEGYRRFGSRSGRSRKSTSGSNDGRDSNRMRKIKRRQTDTLRGSRSSHHGQQSGSVQEEYTRTGLRDPLLAGEMWQLSSGN